jgi:hypothetical protein
MTDARPLSDHWHHNHGEVGAIAASLRRGRLAPPPEARETPAGDERQTLLDACADLGGLPLYLLLRGVRPGTSTMNVFCRPRGKKYEAALAGYQAQEQALHDSGLSEAREAFMLRMQSALATEFGPELRRRLLEFLKKHGRANDTVKVVQEDHRTLQVTLAACGPACGTCALSVVLDGCDSPLIVFVPFELQAARQALRGLILWRRRVKDVKAAPKRRR